MNKITLHGTDDTVMTYHAVYGPEYSAPETGWVLVVTGRPEPMDPQALPVEEVVGDLRAMMPDDQSSLGAVVVFTKAMLESLGERVVELEAKGEDASEPRRRADELRAELEKALPDFAA
jgi:hypothetical protein